MIKSTRISYSKMSFVILNKMYFPIILSLSSDDQQFHQYQENEQSHFSRYFCFIFFLYKIIVNISASSRCYYYGYLNNIKVFGSQETKYYKQDSQHCLILSMSKAD
jgi:hypothetical protein